MTFSDKDGPAAPPETLEEQEAAAADAAEKAASKRKKILMSLGLVVLLGLGGGYYYLNSMAVMEEEIAEPVFVPPPRLKEVPPEVKMDEAIRKTINDRVRQYNAGQEKREKLMEEAAKNGGVLPVDPVTGAVVDPLAAPVAGAVDPLAPAPSLDPSADPAVPPSETPAPPGAEPVPGTEPKAGEAPADPAAPPMDPVMEEGKPPVQGSLALPPGVSPAPDAAAPSEAELAIVQNAAAVGELAPQDTTVSGTLSGAEATADAVPDVDVTPALIRPLPEDYLVVRKDRPAEDADARLTAARRALTQNDNQAALMLFSELAGDYPKDKRIMMGKAVTLQRLGQNAEALTAYEDLLMQEPKNLEALTNMLGLLKAQDSALAVEKLNELRQTYPGNADLAAQLGVAQGAAGNYPEALKYLSMAEALKPGSAQVLYNRAIVLDKMGRAVDAAESYRQILFMAENGTLDQKLPLEAIRKRLAVLR